MKNHLHRSQVNLVSFGRIGSVEQIYRLFKGQSCQSLRRACAPFLVGLAALVGMTGCGIAGSQASQSSQTPIISVNMTQIPPVTLVVGNSVQVSATIDNDTANAGVEWVATCASAAPQCGSFSPSHTASGGTTTFTAPSAVPVNSTISVTALSETDRSKAFAAPVTIISLVTGVTLLQPPPASLPSEATITLAAKVIGDPAHLGVDWKVTCGITVGLQRNPVDCTPPNLHSDDGGSTPFSVPGPTQITNIVGSTITFTAFAIADHKFSASTLSTVTLPITINLTQTPPSTMLTNATAPITAVVANDSTNAGVNWSVTCSTAPTTSCGSVVPVHTASGETATFTAPPTVPTGSPPIVTITATGAFGALATATVTIVPPISVKITQGVPNGSIVQATSAALVATVSNDPSSGGVDWTVTCGSPGACGSFSATHTASGVPTTFMAPGVVPVGNTVTITATATSDSTKSDTEIVTVTASVSPLSLLQGQFVIVLTAKNSSNGPYALGGVIAGDGIGNITNGVFDYADASGNASGSVRATSSSTYSMQADGRGQITMQFNSFGPSATITLSVVIATSVQTNSGPRIAHALLSEIDSFGGATGTLDFQNPADLGSIATGPLNGIYSLKLSGVEVTATYPGYFVDAAVSIQSSASSYTETAYFTDQSDRGAIVSVQSPVAYLYSQLAGGGASTSGEFPLSSFDLGLPTKFSLDLWLIDASHFAITDWRDSAFGSPPAIIAGYLTLQPASPSISGTYAFAEAGATTPTTAPAQPQVAGGILTCGSTGTLDVTPLNGTPATNLPITAACTAPANGRGLITISGAGSTGISQLAAYPTVDQGLYLIELDGGSAGTSGPSGAGVALQQTVPPVLPPAATGNYASNFSASTAVGVEIFNAQILSDGVSKLSGIADLNSFNATAGTPSSGATLTGSFPAGTNGRVPLMLTITPATGQPTNINPACYVVDANTCLLLGLDSVAPGTGILLMQHTGL